MVQPTVQLPASEAPWAVRSKGAEGADVLSCFQLPPGAGLLFAGPWRSCAGVSWPKVCCVSSHCESAGGPLPCGHCASLGLLALASTRGGLHIMAYCQSLCSHAHLSPLPLLQDPGFSSLVAQGERKIAPLRQQALQVGTLHECKTQLGLLL